jgi:hypothetical protein
MNIFLILDFVHHLVIGKLDNTTFRKLDLFLSLGEWETPNLLGPLERVNLNHWRTHVSQSRSQSYFSTGSLPLISWSRHQAP